MKNEPCTFYCYGNHFLVCMVCRQYVRLVVPELNETGKAPLVGGKNL